MNKSFGSDTNLQTKFWNSGREIIVYDKIFGYHMSHSKRMGQTILNDYDTFIKKFFKVTENDENWGNTTYSFKENIY